jgi:DNA-binding MarR family transcriptional regulator
MVECLVRAKLITRKTAEADRRQVVLTLTKNGQSVVKKMRGQVEKRLDAHLDGLSVQEQKQVEVALDILQKVFSSNRESAV